MTKTMAGRVVGPWAPMLRTDEDGIEWLRADQFDEIAIGIPDARQTHARSQRLGQYDWGLGDRFHAELEKSRKSGVCLCDEDREVAKAGVRVDKIVVGSLGCRAGHLHQLELGGVWAFAKHKHSNSKGL